MTTISIYIASANIRTSPNQQQLYGGMLRQIFDSCNIYYQPNIITSNPQAQEGDGKLDDTVDIEDHDTTDGDEDETDDDDDNDAGVVFVDRDKVRKDLLPLFAACAEE